MKLPHSDKKTPWAIAAILALGAILLALILTPGKPTGDTTTPAKEGTAPAHDDAGHAAVPPQKGPHGGSLHHQRKLQVEVLLAERDGTARHQLWAWYDGKPLAPAAISATGQLTRPQGIVEQHVFAAQDDSLQGTAAIAEPHLFAASLTVKAAGEVVDIAIDSAEGLIALTDAQAKAAGITIDTAAPARIRSAFQLAGEIRFNEDRTAHMTPRLAGVVESVRANLGQQVKKGDILAVIASADVSGMRSELLTAQQKQELAEVTFMREKKLWQDKITAEQDYLQAQQALREAGIVTRNARQKLAAIGASTATTGSPGALSRYELRAPFDGAIVEKHIALGEAVKEDSNVFIISDLSSVWAEIVVPARDLNVVRVGERATVRATSMDSSANGVVSYIGALLGEQTRTATGRVTLANPSLAWRPGLFVNVTLTSEERDAAVAVLSDAIQTVGDRPTVFVRTAGGFVGQPVTLGRSDGKRTEILTGIKAGAAYAARGSFVVKAEQGKGSVEHDH
ncbi:MAG: efflux RND transporter periplasmic adaptor subunit [Pseudomonadota bacterium]|nr:efflux RND transporter periplasmic adaptor subunit [Pseudomonadota bacterium]